MSISSYTAVQGWADDQKWTDSVMDAFVDNLETWIANNVVALCPDKTGIENITGNWTFSGNNVFSGTELHSGASTWSGSSIFSGIYTFNNNGTFSGNSSFTGTNTFTGSNTFSGSNVFSGANTLTLPTAAPTSANNVGLVSGILKTYNSTTSFADPYLRTDTYNSSTYTGGDINIGTTNDGAFADVDATNAQITFTVNTPGRYKVEFDFVVFPNFTAAATVASVSLFRLTDGTSNGSVTGVRWGANINGGGTIGGASTSEGMFCSSNHVFNFTTTGSKTVKLQKQNINSTSINTRVILANTTDVALIMRAYRIAD